MKVFLITFLLSIQVLFGQKYDNIWVFGNEPNSAINGEINFQTGMPILVPDVKPIGFFFNKCGSLRFFW